MSLSQVSLSNGQRSVTGVCDCDAAAPAAKPTACCPRARAVLDRRALAIPQHVSSASKERGPFSASFTLGFASATYEAASRALAADGDSDREVKKNRGRAAEEAGTSEPAPRPVIPSLRSTRVNANPPPAKWPPICI